MIKDQQVKGPRGGFTLIELLAVIAIIGILVGVVIGVGGNVRQKAAKSRAKAEIAAIELALERYKIDNGDYPNWPGIGGSDVYTGNPSNYEASLVDSGGSEGQRSLYEQLVGRRQFDANATDGSVQYYEVKESQSVQQDQDAYFADPFGFAYGYKYDASASGVNKSIFNQVAPDIWSTAGQNSTASVDSSDSTHYIYLRWITNWGSN